MQFLVSNPYFRPSLWPTLFLIASLPILLWLGTWQLQRLEWKLGLVEQMEARLDAPAITIEDVSPGIDDEFRRYSVSGTFENAVEFHWLATSEAYGIGYLIFSPFTLKDGRKAIVNRGFVPSPLKDAMADRPGGRETFEAIARAPETPGALDATNDVDANIWFTRDIAAMAALAGGGDYLPIYFEKAGIVADDVWPKPGAAKVTPSGVEMEMNELSAEDRFLLIRANPDHSDRWLTNQLISRLVPTDFVSRFVFDKQGFYEHYETFGESFRSHVVATIANTYLPDKSAFRRRLYGFGED